MEHGYYSLSLADVLKTHEGVEKVVAIKKNFDGVAKWNNAEMPFRGFYADNDFFTMFNFPLAKGNPATALTEADAVVLTQKLATKIFGDKDPLNQVIEVEGQGEFIVTGVFEEFPGKSHLDFEALASTSRLPLLEKEDKLSSSLNDWHFIYDNYVYITLKEEADIADIQPLLQRASTDNYEEDSEYQYIYKAQPITKITPGPLLSNTSGFGLPMLFVYVMLGMAVIVLSSAAFNYANLTTARAIRRAKEIGVRKVVGARKINIIAQFIIEAIVISLFAFTISILLVEYLHPMLNNMFAQLGAPISFDKTPGLYWIFFGFAVATGLLAGLVPAFFFAATDPLIALKKAINIGKLGKTSNRFGIRKVLVVAQFAFSIFFVITMIALYQQMNLVLNNDHGVRIEGVVSIDLQGMDYETIQNEYAQLANVNSVAATSHLPALGTNYTAEVSIDDGQEPFNISYSSVDGNYAELMGLEIISGRNFPKSMPKDETYILINEKAVERMGWQEPQNAIGQVIQLDDDPVEIIGVVKNFNYERLDEEIGPMALRHRTDRVNKLIVTINSQQEKETLAILASGWKKHTNRPFEYSFYKDDLRNSYGHFELLLKLIGYVTVVVVSIACLGLLGMVIFHVQHKSMEIGIRKIFGANSLNILLITGKSFLTLITISYIIGGPLSYFVNNLWLEAYVYRIDFGIATILFGFAIVIAVVILTISSQLFRAMRVKPVDILKED